MRPIVLLAILLVAGPVSATIVSTAESASGSQTQYPASGADLINQGQATLASATHAGYAPYTGTGTTSTDALNDGILGTDSVNTDSAFDLDGTWTSTYYLNTTVNTYGYDLTSIVTLGGWIADRAGQQYTVSYRTTGGSSFATLGIFTNAFIGSGSSRTTITEDTTGILAANVDAVRFDIVPQGSSDVYRELDVFGTASSNPPPPPPPPTTREIAPDDPQLGYSDYANLTADASAATFDRLIDAASGMRWDNPGARVRFRTDATNLTATVSYTAQHTHGAQDGTGIVLRDGVVVGSCDPSSRPGLVTVTVPTTGAVGFHDYEILMPYADSVQFNGLTVNVSALFSNLPARPLTRYVAYGDSITQGYWASDPTKNYPSQVGTSKSWQVINMGFGGRQATGSDGLVLGSLNADLITLLMGVNDALATKSAAQFETDYTDIIAGIRSQQADVPIYAITPLWTTVGGELHPGVSDVFSNLVLSASDPNLFLIDGLTLIPNSTTYFPDGIHPNDAGFALMAANLSSLLNLQGSAVPEPSALALIGLGAGLAVGCGRFATRVKP